MKILFIYHKAPKIIIFLDNVRYHHARLLKKFLDLHPKLELIYLPPYSPDLNPIERVWWFMRKKITHNRFLTSLKERKIKFWQMFSHFTKPNQTILQVCVIKF
jgi:transposase